MVSKLDIHGLVAATFAPMREDRSLNLDAVGPMVDFLHREGIRGLYVCGSTGEGPLLTTAERQATAAAYVRAAAGRMPVIVHVGHSSPAEARGLAAHAQQIGADAISAVSPWYFKPGSVEILVECLAQIAGGAPELPFYYYHIPMLTGVALDMTDLLRRAPGRIGNFVGMKYTSPAVDELQALLEFEGGRFEVMFGRDEMLLSALAIGVRGAVGSTYNFAAGLYNRLVAAFERGDLAEARACQARSVAMIHIMLRYPAMATFKSVMTRLGVDCGPVRAPLPNLAPAERAKMEKELEAIGFFEWRA